MIYIPGFRTRKPLKMIIASLYYLMCFGMLTEGIGYALGLLSMPLVYFYTVSLFKGRDRRFVLPLIASTVAFFVAIAVTPAKENNFYASSKQVESGKINTSTAAPNANDVSSPASLPTSTKALATPSPIPQEDETCGVTVKLESVDMTYNNSVGNEWTYGASVGGKELKIGDSISLSYKVTGKIVIQAHAEELDKIPDYGSSNLGIDVGSLEKGKKNTCSTEVVVRENRGRYAGNTAGWKFTFSVVKK